MLSVPYFDWVKGQGNVNAQKQYLRDLLVPHVKTVFMEERDWNDRNVQPQTCVQVLLAGCMRGILL